MRQTSEVFIPIPKSRSTNALVEVSGTDVTGRIIKSKWIKPSQACGTFILTLANAMGQYTDSFQIGDTVKFYIDNTGQGSGTPRLQFWGRVDYPKDVLKKEGQFLEIEGRHRAYITTETLVCHSATDTDPAQILKDVVDKYFASYGFTYTNVSSTTVTMDIEWNYKPFWDCFKELCNKAGFDGYVDNDLDFHFFEENSILNENEAIAERDNFLETEDWGTDDYYERTRVIAMGQDDNQLPIVYTAISDGEGDSIREVFIKDSSANTETKVQALAEAKLAELTNRPPQAVMKSLGLATIEPAENMWIVVPRQRIYGQYKIMQITHLFGQKSGGWQCHSLVEKDIGGTDTVIQSIQITQQQTTQAENPNKLNFTYNFTFDDDSKTKSHDGTEVSNGKLIIASQSGTEGTWLSSIKSVSDNVTEVEMRIKGKDLKDSEFYFSLNAGNTWEQIEFSDLGTKITPDSIGRNVMIKVVLKRSSGWEYLLPELDSLVLLYS